MARATNKTGHPAKFTTTLQTDKLMATAAAAVPVKLMMLRFTQNEIFAFADSPKSTPTVLPSGYQAALVRPEDCQALE